MVTACNITRLTISLFWRLPPTSLPDAISTIPRTSTKSVASAPSAIRMKKKLFTPRGLRFLVQPANRQIAASEPCEQRRRVCARPAHLLKRQRAISLRQAAASSVRHQRMVVVAGCRQAQQRLQQPVDVGCGEQILTPHHIGYPLCGVVHRHRQMIGRGRIFSRSEEHTSELQSLMRISYAVFCLKKKITK